MQTASGWVEGRGLRGRERNSSSRLSLNNTASFVVKKIQFRFEKLDCWKLARGFSDDIYKASKCFPKDEVFGLTSQIRRAAVSVSSNIAEGSGRNSDADFSHFLEIAYASLMEVISQLYLALDQEYVTEEQVDNLKITADKLAGKIVGLSKSLGRKPRIKKSQ